jgi:hypothetical protein
LLDSKDFLTLSERVAINSRLVKVMPKASTALS